MTGEGVIGETKYTRKFVIYMSKYLFHVLIGLDGAFPLHLSRLQLEAAEMMLAVHILDTRASATLPNSNRQGGEKGNRLPAPPWTSSLTPNLFLNEAVIAVQMNLRLGIGAVVWLGPLGQGLRASQGRGRGSSRPPHS